MKKQYLLIAALVVLLLATGGVVYKVAFAPKPPAPIVDNNPDESEALPTVDSSVVVDVAKSPTKANTVVLSVKGMKSKYTSVGYELTYDSQGLIKGVNSGSKPIDVTDKDAFDREVYLGTCSKNDCKPDAGVTKVSIVLEFTDAAGKKSQFTKDYDL